MSNEIEAKSDPPSKNKSPWLDGFIAKFYKTIKKLTPMLPKLFHRIEKDGTLPKSFYEASITLITKPHKYITKKKETIDQFPWGT
jgi:hypothetical protein